MPLDESQSSDPFLQTPTHPPSMESGLCTQTSHQSYSVSTMAGRRVYFSFHYEQDIWRASNVRNSGNFDAVARAGWDDASIWEEAKRKEDTAIRRLIDDGLKGTSVTAVLIGEKTAIRPWVQYEIDQSIVKGNGLLGVRVHGIRDQQGRKSGRGPVPKALADGGYRIHDWDASNFSRWVELAAIDAGKACFKHQQERCWKCKFLLRYW